MILDAAANSSDESDGDDYTPTRRRGPQPGNGDHDAATAATDGMFPLVTTRGGLSLTKQLYSLRIDIERNFLDTLQNDPKYKFVVQFKELFRFFSPPPTALSPYATAGLYSPLYDPNHASYVHRTREGLLAPTSAEKLVHGTIGSPQLPKRIV
jgi:hypothetical protein